ncbi:MAG: glycoside hydrolase family 27 protein [Clostridia bacterium]|nr:glycoside hydrolase family 27 protein [Clostridia bacterium]
MVIRAQRPPMGWNSWNGYLGSPDEKELKATMRYIASRLLPYGYEYAVTDAGWYNSKEGPNEPTAEFPIPHYSCDEYGRPWPHPLKYPSAADGTGFLHISEYAHSLGLKFGLHMMRGIDRGVALNHGWKVKGTNYELKDVIDLESGCSWCATSFGLKVDHPGSQAYYDSLFENFAAWEIDFVKYDDLGSPIHREEIEMIHKAIDKCGRDIVFSLSPGNWVKMEDAAFYSEHATMWRISQDFWDDWDVNLRESFDLLAAWNEHIEEPGWPDADMIPIGHICENPCTYGIRPRLSRFTPDEEQSLFTLFSIARSPLILTNNLLKNDERLLYVQAQPDCIAVNQRGEGNRVLLSGKDAETHMWRAHADGHDYLAFFNLTKRDKRFTFPIPENLVGKMGIDVWSGDFIPPLEKEVTLAIPVHGVIFVRLR